MLFWIRRVEPEITLDINVFDFIHFPVELDSKPTRRHVLKIVILNRRGRILFERQIGDMGSPLSIVRKLLQYRIELGAGVFIKIAFYILRVESTLFRFIIALNYASEIFK